LRCYRCVNRIAQSVVTFEICIDSLELFYVFDPHVAVVFIESIPIYCSNFITCSIAISIFVCFIFFIICLISNYNVIFIICRNLNIFISKFLLSFCILNPFRINDDASVAFKGNVGRVDIAETHEFSISAQILINLHELIYICRLINTF